MEAIFCLGAAASAPSFPAGPNARCRATRLPGGAVPVACALSPAAYPPHGAAAAPLPWGTKPPVRSSNRTAAGGGDGSPGSLDDFPKQYGGHDKTETAGAGGGLKDMAVENGRDSRLKPGEQQLLPNEDALTEILPLEKRFQLLEHLNNLALAKNAVTTLPVLSVDWLSSDEKLTVGFALSLVYFEKVIFDRAKFANKSSHLFESANLKKEYAKAKQVLEKLLRHEASSDTSRVPFFVATLIATMLALEIHLQKDKTS